MEIVKNIEQAHGLTSLEEENAEQGQSRVSVIQGLSSLPTSMFERILLLFCHPYSVRTSVLWILWFGISMSYYAIYIYLPAIIGKTGYNIAATWENILLITAFQLPGYLAASYLVEVFGRKKTLVAFLMGSFVFAIIMAYVPGTKENAIVFCGCCLSFFLLGAWGCVYAYTPENYPTAIRGMGSAYPAGFSRIGAFIGPYLIPFMDQEWGMSIAGIMWVFGGVLIFISLVVLAFGFEPKGKDLETMEEFEQQKEEEYHGAETPIWR
jgi:putative MFS transporter